jgi:CHAD domain-containing protein
MKEGWGGPHLDDTHDLRIVVRKLRKTIEVDLTRLRILLS